MSTYQLTSQTVSLLTTVEAQLLVYQQQISCFNVTFTNNNMTAVEVWNGALQFIGINKIQNNHGTGVHYLQGSSYISSNSELNFLNNTARTVGGAVFVSDKRKFQNDYTVLF